ncbi:hypothetical protein KJ693_05780, partial [bacterium]|nr:hypothetical protein [bacterium]
EDIKHCEKLSTFSLQSIYLQPIIIRRFYLMATIEGYEMPDDLYYHQEHAWARVEDNINGCGE